MSEYSFLKINLKCNEMWIWKRTVLCRMYVYLTRDIIEWQFSNEWPHSSFCHRRGEKHNKHREPGKWKISLFSSMVKKWPTNFGSLEEFTWTILWTNRRQNWIFYCDKVMFDIWMMRINYGNSVFEPLSPFTCHESSSSNRKTKSTISHVSLEWPYTLSSKSVMKVVPIHWKWKLAHLLIYYDIINQDCHRTPINVVIVYFALHPQKCPLLRKEWKRKAKENIM